MIVIEFIIGLFFLTIWFLILEYVIRCGVRNGLRDHESWMERQRENQRRIERGEKPLTWWRQT